MDHIHGMEQEKNQNQIVKIVSKRNKHTNSNNDHAENNADQHFRQGSSMQEAPMQNTAIPPAIMLGTSPSEESKITRDSKKNSRNRKTDAEMQSFSRKCIDGYLKGRATSLIAHDLNVRVDEVKRVLWDFVQTHQDKLVPTRTFLASASTRMKDIAKEKGVAAFYEVVIQDDGTRIFTPIGSLVVSE